MKQILFHGSKDIVGQPIFGKGKVYNDYGLGFYCTRESELAREWAVSKDKDGYVNQYELDMDNLNQLDLNSNQYTVLHWLGVLLDNRIFELTTPLEREAKRYILENFYVEFKDVDIVKGYRADDSYFAYARDFISGVISLEQLSVALHLGNLGEQICLKSKKAFDTIKVLGYEKVSYAEYYPKKMIRERAARGGYKDMEKQDYRKGELYINRIIDEELKEDAIRIRQSISV